MPKRAPKKRTAAECGVEREVEMGRQGLAGHVERREAEREGMQRRLVPLPTHLQPLETGGDMEVEEFILEVGPPKPPQDSLDRAGSGWHRPETTEETTEGPC